MVLNFKVQEFAYINQVAQEIRGGAVICLTIGKLLSREILHSALTVSQSLVSAFDIWNVGVFKMGCYPSAHPLVAGSRRERKRENSCLV